MTRIARKLAPMLPLAAALAWLCSSQIALAQESAAPEPSAWGSFAAALSTDGGRAALAGGVYALLALAKLIPAVRDAATPGGKIFAVVALGLGAGAAAWSAPGCSVWVALVTAGAASAGAVFAHEAIEKVARLLLPVLAAIPRVGPAIAAAVRAVFVPSSPPVDVAAERSLKSVSKTGAVLIVLLSLGGCLPNAQAVAASSFAHAINAARPRVVAIEQAEGDAAIDAATPPVDAAAATAPVERRWTPVWLAYDALRAAQNAWADAIIAGDGMVALPGFLAAACKLEALLAELAPAVTGALPPLPPGACP